MSSLAKLAAVVSIFGALSFAVGCAAPAAGEETEESGSSLSTGTFKLYADDATVDPECDIHTELTLASDRTPGGVRASLRNVVSGTCRIYIDPEPRDFRLELAGTDCGSLIYKATETVEGDKHAITIIDNRDRQCRDVAPDFVVEEDLGGELRRLQAL